MARPKFDARTLAEAVESAPDYAQVKAEQVRLYALKQEADGAYAAASRRMDEIWDREATRLFGPPPTRGSTPGGSPVIDLDSEALWT
ncbi:MAG: hypothetical protein WBV64_15270 [Mycobacterium sp.]